MSDKKRSNMGFYEATLYVDSILETSHSIVRKRATVNWFRRVHGERAINAMLACMLQGQHETVFRFANRMSICVPSQSRMTAVIESLMCGREQGESVQSHWEI